MLLRKIVENLTAFVFEGTSDGDDVVAALNAHKPSGEFEVISESGSSLTVSGIWSGSEPTELTVDADGAYIWRGEDWIGERTAAQMAYLYRDEAGGVVTWGAAQVPAILLNGNANVAVSLIEAMADTNYDATAQLVGAIGSLTINSVTITDEDTVTVNVQAGLAFAGGASVVVMAKP